VIDRGSEWWASPVSYWCCAQLAPHKTALALHTLALAGFEAYHPRLRVARRSFGRKIETQPSLFPGYCFVAIELQWYAARWAPGVIRIVMDGTRPAVVPDAVIAEIKARERGGLIELPKRGLEIGDRVRVLHGPFREVIGLYAGQAAHERIAILLSLLGGQHRVTLSRDAVEAV
jgi:transcriptional antiterminator RfaH